VGNGPVMFCFECVCVMLVMLSVLLHIWCVPYHEGAPYETFGRGATQFALAKLSPSQLAANLKDVMPASFIPFLEQYPLTVSTWIGRLRAGPTGPLHDLADTMHKGVKAVVVESPDLRCAPDPGQAYRMVGNSSPYPMICPLSRSEPTHI